MLQVDNSNLQKFIIGNIIAFIVFIFTLGRLYSSFTEGQKITTAKLNELSSSLSEVRQEIREKYLTKEADGYKEQVMAQRVDELAKQIEEIKREHREAKRRPGRNA